MVTGTVAEVHTFGIFVHIDGEPEGLRTGFIRVPDLTWSRIDHPSDAVEAGQRITAEVSVAETRSGQVAVSLKALQEDPLIRFADQVDRVDRVAIGSITKIIPLGVFVQLAPDVEGRLHLSELTDEPVEDPAQLVGEGELITVTVAEVDLRHHRVRLCAADGAGSHAAPPEAPERRTSARTSGQASAFDPFRAPGHEPKHEGGHHRAHGWPPSSPRRPAS
ncbi:S1 RNA-binding domain-containing protein [Streptomyces sp. NPDC015125]|uniref:S1 RNA-binding domain-containing protein n=1 Tax=Streptomyces sp. NPDC015125 TaxID=3364938 RepID=UPI0036F649A5